MTVREENMTLLSRTVLKDKVENICVKKKIDLYFGAGEEKRKLMNLKLYKWWGVGSAPDEYVLGDYVHSLVGWYRITVSTL